MRASAKRIYDWASVKAGGRYAPVWLGLIFLLELIFFLPLDAILVLFCLENPSRRYLYATLATIASTLGGIIGYALGLLAWDFIGPFVMQYLISPTFFGRISFHYQEYQNWAVAIGSFLPLPFKAISLSAGVCKLALIPFITSVFFARLTRFFLVAAAVHKWGDSIKGFIERHFGRVLMVIGAKIAIALGLFWMVGQ